MGKPGEITASSSAFPSTPEGWFPVKGKTRSHLNFESRPGVYDHCLLHGGLLKSALGCLTYSRIWCLSRGKRNILWPESCKGTELGKWSQVSRFQSFRVSGFQGLSTILGTMRWRGCDLLAKRGSQDGRAWRGLRRRELREPTTEATRAPEARRRLQRWLGW